MVPKPKFTRLPISASSKLRRFTSNHLIPQWVHGNINLFLQSTCSDLLIWTHHADLKNHWVTSSIWILLLGTLESSSGMTVTGSSLFDLTTWPSLLRGNLFFDHFFLKLAFLGLIFFTASACTSGSFTFRLPGRTAYWEALSVPFRDWPVQKKI